MYTDNGQQGRCMSPGAVGGVIVDRLTEQAAEQWEVQDHPGWNIFEDDGDACEAVPVGPTNGRVQLSFHTLSAFQSLLTDKRIHTTRPHMSAKAVHSVMLRHAMLSWLFMGWCIIAL